MTNDPSISKRQQAIMEFIRQHGAVEVDSLTEVFNVTPQTIRRDLNHLYDREMLQRVHGGAIIRGSVENLGYGARKRLMSEEKSAIARRVAELIPDNSSLFINIGTTNEAIARYLLDHQGLLVITNNINVASSLWPYRNIEVMVASGTIRHEDGGIVGPSTEEFINRFKVDYAIVGCSAIDGDGEILDYDLREVRVAQAIIQGARSVILATDSVKFQRSAAVRIGNLDQIDYLLTDSGISQDQLAMCQQKDVQVEIVKVDQAESGVLG